MSSDQNHGWFGDYTTQLYRDYNNQAIIRIPVTQPGFYGMSRTGFDYCSYGKMAQILFWVPLWNPPYPNPGKLSWEDRSDVTTEGDGKTEFHLRDYEFFINTG